VTPQVQLITHKGKGDCLRACVASLLDLPLLSVPNFVGDLGKMWFFHKQRGLYAFLYNQGVEYQGCQPPRKAVKLSQGYDGYFIANVPSANFKGKYHSVIFKGLNFFFDPSPLKQWQGTIDNVRDFFIIEKDTEPTQCNKALAKRLNNLREKGIN